jgi:hypothetical protein
LAGKAPKVDDLDEMHAASRFFERRANRRSRAAKDTKDPHVVPKNPLFSGKRRRAATSGSRHE